MRLIQALASVLVETFAVPVAIGLAVMVFGLIMLTAPWSIAGLFLLYLVVATSIKVLR